MSHVLEHDGNYFRIEITEIAHTTDPGKTGHLSWCSDAFTDLKDMPSQKFSRFIGGPPIQDYADALRYAYDWIKSNSEARIKQPDKERDTAAVVYKVWIFNRSSSLGYEFEEYADAQAFAKAAEKSPDSTKVAITNNESPQYLTVWERDK
jgi:hypothetical protein